MAAGEGVIPCGQGDDDDDGDGGGDGDDVFKLKPIWPCS